jgi:Zn-finger nucleic acid-binding protein
MLPGIMGRREREQNAKWRQQVTFVEPTEDDPQMRNPLNGVVMEKFAIEGVVIDRCPETGSIWLDRGELARLGSLSKDGRAVLKQIDRKPPKAERNPPRGGLVSPENGTEMMVLVKDPNQPHIEFEMCPVSGGCFFDPGELVDMIDYSFLERVRSFFRG